MVTSRAAWPTFAREMPWFTRCALEACGAPVETFAEPDGVVAWAEESLGFAFTCGATARGAGGAGRARHWVRVDPHTGQTTPAPTDRQVEKADAVHMLWALTSPDVPPPCVRVGNVLATWVGNVRPHWAPWPNTGQATYRLSNVRAVVRAVEYLDAGLDLCDESGWLVAGVHPDTVRWARDRLAAEGLSAREDSLVEHLQHKVGLHHTLKIGQPAVVDTAWLSAVVEEWVSRRGAVVGRGYRS